MKKLILIAVLLITSVFYVSTTSFKETGYFDNDGHILMNNNIQTYLYSGNNTSSNVETFEVEANDLIFTRWNQEYVGADTKKKINTVYPMYLNDGAAIQFLNGQNVLIDEEFDRYEGYKGLIINNGEAYNGLYEKADINNYIFAKLTNNIYINTQRMTITTIANEYVVPLNSFAYFTPNNLRTYNYTYGYFIGLEISDVNEQSIVKIGNVEISYGELLLKLGEIAISNETNINNNANKTDDIDSNQNVNVLDKNINNKDNSGSLIDKQPGKTQGTTSNGGDKTNSVSNNSSNNNNNGNNNNISSGSSADSSLTPENGEPGFSGGGDDTNDVPGYSGETDIDREDKKDTENKNDNTNNNQTINGSSSNVAENPLPGKDPEEALAPEEADGSTIPGGQITNPNIDSKPPVIQEWEMPEVSVSSLEPTTYTLKTKVNVKDNAGVIRNSSVTFTVYQLDAETKQKAADLKNTYEKGEIKEKEYEEKLLNLASNLKTVKRYTAKVSGGSNDVIISGLSALNEYAVVGSYKYGDKFDKTITKQFYFNFENAKTKDLSALGKVYLKDISFDNVVFYSDKVIVPYVQFDFDEGHDSDVDAISNISRMSITLIDKDNGEEKTFFLVSAGIQALKGGAAYSFTSPSTLSSGKKFDGYLTIYDKDGNKFELINNEFSGTRTCYRAPTATLSALLNSNLTSVSFDANIKNPDNIEFSTDDLFIRIYDSNGNELSFTDNKLSVSSEVGEKEIPLNNEYEVTVSEFKFNRTYSARLFAKCDIDDGKGKVEKVIASKTFVTGDFATWGNLYLNVNNISKQLDNNNKPLLGERETPYRAIFDISIDDVKTNSNIIDLFDNIKMSLNGAGEVYDHVFTTEEIQKLKNGEHIIVDSYFEDFAPNKLKSNTTYSLKFEAKSGEGADQLIIKTSSTLNSVKTPKMPVYVEINALEAFTGYITSSFKVVDLDNVVSSGNEVLLRVSKITKDGKPVKLIGSFNIEIGKEYEIGLYTNESYVKKDQVVTNGSGYNIEENSYYVFDFIAEQMDSNEGIKYNEKFYSTLKDYDIYTGNGVSGDIRLNELSSYKAKHNLPEDYIQLDYIQSTGTQYIQLPFGFDYTDEVYSNFSIDVSEKNDKYIVSPKSWNSNNNRFAMGVYSNGLYTAGFGGITTNNTIMTPNVYNDGKIHEWVYKNKQFTITDLKLTKNCQSVTFGGTSANLKLFYGYNANTKGRIENYTHIKNGSVVCDLVAAKRVSDGELGLYDLANDKFYTNNGTGKFIEGPVTVNYNPDNVDLEDNYCAQIGMDIKETGTGLTDKKVFVEVFRTVNGVTQRITDVDNPLIIDYSQQQNNIVVNYPVFKDSNKDNYYTFKLYAEYSATAVDGSLTSTKVALDEVSFSTEEKIYTISNIDEFFAVGNSRAKYVVINDIWYETTGTVSTDSSVHWNSAANGMNAKIDFQGYAFDYTGTNVVIRYLNKDAVISNLVLKNTPSNQNTTKREWGTGHFISVNYGTLSNIYMEYDESNIEMPYKYESYWTKEPLTGNANTDKNITKYHYKLGGGLTIDNYGTIENFVINCKSDIVASSWNGMAAVCNYAGGQIRNGYVYSSLNNDYKVNVNVYSCDTTANNYSADSFGFGLIAGGNKAGAVIENVYALGNINIVGVFNDRVSNSNTAAINNGVITGFSKGTVRNAYAVGATKYNAGTLGSPVMKATTYGPAVGVVSNVVNNIYYVSNDVSYTSQNSYKYNNQATILSLRSNAWQNGILNIGNGSFKVNEMISSHCYPQVNYSSNVMPVQDLIPLEELTSYANKDVVSANNYVWGSSAEEDEIFISAANNNEPIYGNEIFEQPDSFGYISDWQPVTIVISDHDRIPVESISCEGITIKVITSIFGEDDLTTVYGFAHSPTQALSRYRINSVEFKTYENLSVEDLLLTNQRYLYCEFYQRITIDNVERWISLMHTGKTVTQNISLVEDINFNGYTLNQVYVNGTYSGKFNGNGHKLYGFDFSTFNSNGMSVKTIGLFSNLDSAQVSNLVIQGIYVEGGTRTGFLAGDAINTSIDSVFISDSYMAGSAMMGGLLGHAQTGVVITNSGVRDIKILSTAHGDDYDGQRLGGLIGSMNGLVTVNNAYAQNIYIDIPCVPTVTVAGGLLGYNENGSYSQFTNSYATGVINGFADVYGGLIGMNVVTMTIDSCYSDVDIITSNVSSSGLVGRTVVALPISNCLYFGNILSNNIYGNNDDRLSSVSTIANDSSNISGSNRYYNNSRIDIKYYDANGNVTSKTTSSYNGAGSFAANEWMDYLDGSGSVYAQPNDACLPLLIDKEGNYLYGQTEEYISEFDSYVKMGDPTLTYNSSLEQDTILEIPLSISNIRDENHPNRTINISNVYLDYRYVDKMLEYSIDGTDISFTERMKLSSTKQKTLNMFVSTIIYGAGNENGDSEATVVLKVENNKNLIESYLDTYRITAIEYEIKDGSNVVSTGILKVNKNISIPQQYKEISNIDEWNSFFERDSVFENIKITGDIDFADQLLTFDGEKSGSVVVNRLIGTKNTDRDDAYLDLYDDGLNKNIENPYFSLKNATINSNNEIESNSSYRGVSGLIKGIISECKYLTFDNIKVSYFGYAGVIGSHGGDLNHIIFTNCAVSSTANAYSGAIAISDGTINKVFIDKTAISSSSTYAGILTGRMKPNVRHTSVSDITITNSSVSGSNYTAGIVGSLSTTWNICPSNPFKANDINIENCTISGSSTYTGGITGSLASGITINNPKIINSTIKGSSTYTGGIAGSCAGNGNSNVINNAYIYKTIVRGTSYVGGVSGHYGFPLNAVIEDCDIAGTGDRIGGIWGNTYTTSVSHTGIENDNEIETRSKVLNSRIYGNNYVGGIAGYGNCTIAAAGYVESSEIYGNKYVGGAVGYTLNYFQGVVLNSTISPVGANSYSVATSTSPSYFGGISGQAGRSNGTVKNSVIGGPSVNYVGGISGYYYNADNSAMNNAKCIDSVVIGNNYVAGLVGVMKSYKDSYKPIMEYCYSNAMVVGNDYVAGICGSVQGWLGTLNNVNKYYNNPNIENCYFTGALQSKNRASALFGIIKGDSSPVNFSALVSMPEYIQAKDIQLVNIDSEVEYNYNFNELKTNSGNMFVNYYGPTELKYIDDAGTIVSSTTVSQLVNNPSEKYYSHIATSLNEAKAQADGGYVSGKNRKFIYVYNDQSTYNIPSDYSALEYIDLGAEGYIDTGYVIKNPYNLTLDIDFKFNSNSFTTKNYMLFGLDNGTVRFDAGTSTYNTYFYRIGNSATTNVYPSNMAENKCDNNRHTVSLITTTTDSRMLMDGVEFSMQNSILNTSFSDNTYSLYVGAKRNSSGAAYCADIKLYGFSLTRYGTIVKEFIPVKRNSDGAVGVFDKISGKFVAVKGKSTPIAGPALTTSTSISSSGKQFLVDSILNMSLNGPSISTSGMLMIHSQEMKNSDLMPFTASATGLTIYANGYKSVKTINPWTKYENVIVYSQGVPIPGTDKSKDIISRLENIYDSYMNYLNGIITHDKFAESVGIGNAKNNTENDVSVYLAGADILNIDINNPSVYDSTFYEVEYIEADKTQSIDTGYKIGTGDFEIQFTGEVSNTAYSSNFFFGAGSDQTNGAIGMRFYQGYFAGFLRAVSEEKTTIPATIGKFTAKYKVVKNVLTISITEGTTTKSWSSSSRAGYTSGNFRNLNVTLGTLYNTSSPSYTGKIYGFKIYDKTGTLVRDMIPIANKSGVGALYDKVTNKIYRSRTANDYKYSGEIDTSKQSYTSLGYITIKEVVGGDADDNILLNRVAVDRKTYSIQGNLLNKKLSIILEYGNNKITKTINANDLFKNISSSMSGVYFINPNDNNYIYKVSNTDNSLDYSVLKNYNFVNIYGDEALATDGKVYSLNNSDVRDSQDSINILGESVYLNNGSITVDDLVYSYTTYGTYSKLGTEIKPIKIYTKSPSVLFINQKENNAVGMDVFIHNTNSGNYVAYLNQKDGLSFVGSHSINIGSLPNKNIAFVASNLNVTNDNSPILLIQYNDGSIGGVDVTSGNSFMIIKSNAVSTLSADDDLNENGGIMSLFSFMSRSFMSLFSLNDTDYGASLYSNEFELANKLESDLDDEVISLFALDEYDARESIDEIEEIENVDLFVESINTNESDDEIDSNESDDGINSEEIVGDIQSEEQKAVLLDDNNEYPAVRSSILNLEPIETNIKVSNGIPSETLMISNSVKVSDYTVTYNEKTDQFEVYSTKELLFEGIDNKTEEVTKPLKIIDKATLKSLYQSFEEKDYNDERGYALYGVVALAILLLTAAIVLFEKKK